MTPPPRYLFLIFLGRRGGGSQIFFEISEGLINRGFPKNRIVCVLSRNSETIVPEGIRTIYLPTINSTKELIRNSPAPLILWFKLYKFAKEFKPSFCIYIMPSPFDKLLYIVLKKNKPENFFMIHDSAAHLGEIWPRKRSIIWRVRSANIVGTFSDFIHSEIKNLNTNATYIKLSLPNQLHIVEGKNDYVSHEIASLESDYLLFVGRIESYKGITNLVQAFENCNLNLKLIIAGEGEFKLNSNSKIVIINRWLTELEIISLIQKSKVVIFPYLEASQSGLVPIVRHFKKPMIVSDVGGLREQVTGYRFVTFIQPNSIISIENAINALFETNSEHDPDEKPTIGLVDEVFRVLTERINPTKGDC